MSKIFNIPLISFITPGVGEWTIIQKFKLPVQAIIYDSARGPRPDSLKAIGWPYSRMLPVLTFTEIITGTDEVAANSAVISDRGVDVGEKKYKSIDTIFGTDIMIGTRQERVKTIKQLEMHPAIVVATSKEKVNFTMVIMITIRVDDPIKALRITNFLGVTANLIVEAFRRWGAKNSYDKVTRVNTNNNPHVPDEICDYIEKLNETEFAPNGIQVPHVAVVRIAVAEDSEDVPKSERQIIVETNNVKTAEKTAAIEIIQNGVQEKKNNTKVKFLKDELEVQAAYIEKTSDKIVQQNKAWGGDSGLRTLIVNDQKSLNQSQIQTIQVADATSN